MLRRITAISRPSVAQLARPQARAFSKSAASAVSASNILFELDSKKVGHEIRKRGLTNAVTSPRDGSMDRVSIVTPPHPTPEYPAHTAARPLETRAYN